MKKILKFTLITMIVTGLAGSCFSDVSASPADSTEIVVDSVVVDSTQVTVE